MKTLLYSVLGMFLFASCNKRYECRCQPVAPLQEACSFEFEVKAANSDAALELCKENTCEAARNYCTLK